MLLLLTALFSVCAAAGSTAHGGFRSSQATSRPLAGSHSPSSCADAAHANTRSIDHDGGNPASIEEYESPAKKRRPHPLLKTAKASASRQSADYRLLAEALGSSTEVAKPRLWRDAHLHPFYSGDPALRLHRGRAPPLA